jgi:hypothetical protein
MKTSLQLIATLLVATAIAAQTIKVTTPVEPEVVTLTLAYWNSDPDFKAKECFWYLPQPQRLLLLVHSGCDSFEREYRIGTHGILLIVNGQSKKLGTANDQRSMSATIKVQSRFDVNLSESTPAELRNTQKGIPRIEGTPDPPTK